MSGESIVHRVVYGNEGDRVRAIWRGLVPVLIGSLCITFGPALLSLVLGLDPGAEYSAGTALVASVSIGLFLLAATGVALFVATRLDRRPYGSFGFEWSVRWARDLVGGILLGITMAGVGAWYLQTRGYVTLSIDVSGVDGASGLLAGGLVLGLFIFVLANNVIEEVLFRGIMLTNFAEGLTDRSLGAMPAVGGAVAASLLFFGLLHLLQAPTIHWIATSAGLGLVFAVAYVLTGTLALPIGIHFGGTALISMSQDALIGEYTLPTVITLEFHTQGLAMTYELLIVRILVGVLLVLAWVSIVYGRPSLETVARFSNRQPT